MLFYITQFVVLWYGSPRKLVKTPDSRNTLKLLKGGGGGRKSKGKEKRKRREKERQEEKKTKKFQRHNKLEP